MAKNASPLMPTIIAVAATLSLYLGAYGATARAETMFADGALSVVPSDIACPARGMTMQKVEAKFGAPAERHPTVGTPSITRWDYQSFSVFFENDRVIHSVVTAGPAPAPAQGNG
jgi:hypothetical protein